MMFPALGSPPPKACARAALREGIAIPSVVVAPGARYSSHLTTKTGKAVTT
jgi:hypothetical protein